MGGQLMISDDGGSNWTFRLLEAGGIPTYGNLTAIRELTANGQHRLVTLMSYMEDAPGGDFPFAAKTYLFYSDDNGGTWTKLAFPITSEDFQGRKFYGLDLNGLHVAPGGQLLAYGTTTISDNLVIYWHIGGLIYHSSDGINWENRSSPSAPSAG